MAEDCVDWRSLTRFVLRGTGFPFDLLDTLRCERSAELAAELAEAGSQAPAELVATGRRMFAEELAQRRDALWKLAGSPSVREAIWLSNPAVYEHELSSARTADPGTRPAWIKRRERTIYSYLQRLAAKNDTTSFFGPLNYGLVGAPTLTLSPKRITVRRPFVAYHAAARLAELIGVGPIPESSLDPLAILMDAVRQLPDGPGPRRWLADLATLAELARAFAAAPWPGRRQVLQRAEAHYAAIAGPRANRSDGRMYRDRTLLYEECRGDVEVLRLPALRSALTPALDLCGAFSVLEHQDLRAAGRALFERISPDGRAVPFARFASAWRRAHPVVPPTPSADRLAEAVADLVRARSTGNLARLSEDDVRTLCPESSVALVVSPDVMIAAEDFDAVRRGEYQLVLGEVHHGIQPAGWMLSTAPDAGEWERELVSHLPPGSANVVFGRRMKVAPPEFPGLSIQVSGTAASAERVDLTELEVRGGDRLHLARSGAEVTFRPPSFGVPASSYAVFACFSAPLVRAPSVRLGPHTPRIEVGDVVFQRRRWVASTQDIPIRRGTSFDSMVDLAAFRREHDLPERVFVRSPAEPKPVYIDFTCVFALDLLTALAGRCAELRFEEMLPGPDQLWLHRDDGAYCTEVRTVLSRGGAG
jgi:hypothetical protein